VSAEPAKPPFREALRELVLSLQPGERLPAERALAEQWGVARMTVRTAIATLAREGLVRTVHGSGSTRVAPPVSLRVRLGSFAEAVEAQGLRPSTRLLELGEDPDPPSGAVEHLGPEGLPAVLVRRLRLGDDLPLAIEEAWLPRRLVPDLDETAAVGSLYAHLAAHDLLPDAGEETVSADLPDAQEVRLLGVSASRPVLRLTRRATVRGTPVEYARAVFPGDRHELWFSLDADRLRSTAR
jgi:GntR family transcriptional regulator